MQKEQLVLGDGPHLTGSVLKIDVAFYLGLKTLEKIRSIVPSF
jgi:hypothetical protein